MIQPRRAPLAIALLVAIVAPAPALASAASTAGTAPSAGTATAAGLPARLQQVLAAQGVPERDVSIVVRDAVTGAVHLDLNGGVPRSPASTLKVLTSYAALDELGPAHRWTTRAWATGPVVDGRLQGDLVIEGGGDPTLNAERWWRFARELRNTGLRVVEGNVVLDRTVWAPVPGDRYEFDGRGYRTYNVPPDPLLVNVQSVEMHFLPRAGRVDVIVDPEPSNLALTNSIRVVDAGCRSGLRGVTFTTFDDYPNRIALGGRLSSRCPPLSVRRAVMTPEAFAYGTFVTNWRSLGGEVRGAMRLAPKPDGARPLLEFGSPPLAEVIGDVNKFSSNSTARTLVLTLAAERAGRPATVAAGEDAIRAWLGRRGLPMPELVIDNGSGLSRLSRMSADSMARLLGDAYGSRWYPELAASMPLGGLDGTLRGRFAEYANEGRIRLKTGQLNGVAAIAGWVTSRSGRPLSVVVFVNHPGAQYGSGQAVVDAAVRWALER